MRYFIFFIIILQASLMFAQESYKQGDIVYIKVQSENLRLSPQGTVITQLTQATKATVLGEEGNWVAVQIVGWIWKPSLTAVKYKIENFYMRALHIMVPTEAEAKEIKRLLDSVGYFMTLSKERSKAPNASKGGDLGKISKGDLLPELDTSISNLKVGEISQAIKSDLGFHIFTRLE